MRVKNDYASPFGIQLWMTKDEMDKMCLAALRESKRYLPVEPGPVDIERFIESSLNIPIDYQDLGEGYLGCAMFGKKGKPLKIIISEGLLEDRKPAERRLRSTLAHEAGHCLFHPMLFMEGNPQSELFDEDVDIKNCRILCRDTLTANTFDGRWWEYQANRAIGGLLLPKPLVESALKDILAISPITKIATLPPDRRIKAIDAVSNIFDVNPIVARIRIDEMFQAGEDRQLAF